MTITKWQETEIHFSVSRSEIVTSGLPLRREVGETHCSFELGVWLTRVDQKATGQTEIGFPNNINALLWQ